MLKVDIPSIKIDFYFKDIFYKVYEKCQNKTFNIKDGYRKRIKQIDKELFKINNNLDQMYIDKLRGILEEENYIRISEKFNSEKAKLNEQKKELEQKLIEIEDKVKRKNRTKKEKNWQIY